MRARGGIALCSAGLIAGLVLGRFSLALPQGAPPPPPPTPPHRPPECPSAPWPGVAPTSLAEVHVLRRRIADLESKIRALASSGPSATPQDAAPPAPRPLSFPANTPPDLLPRAFRDSVAEVLAECHPGATLQDTECSEYPCIAWITLDDERWAPERPRELSFADCAPWRARIGARETIHARRAPDGTVFIGVMPVPEDPELARTSVVRSRQRFGALAEAWGMPAARDPASGAAER